MLAGYGWDLHPSAGGELQLVPAPEPHPREDSGCLAPLLDLPCPVTLSGPSVSPSLQRTGQTRQPLRVTVTFKWNGSLGSSRRFPRRDLCPEPHALFLSQAGPRFPWKWKRHQRGHQRP